MRTGLILGLLGLPVLLTGCCWDCAGNDGYEFLDLSFSDDSLTGRGYRRAELRTAYVVRYTDRRTMQVLDTLRQPNDITLYWPQAQLGVLFVAAPNAVQAPAQSFRVVVPASNRTYDLEELDVVVNETNCGCVNTRLRGLNVDGQRRETMTTLKVILEK